MFSHSSNWIKTIVPPMLFLCDWLMFAQYDMVLPMQIYPPSLSQAPVLSSSSQHLHNCLESARLCFLLLDIWLAIDVKKKKPAGLFSCKWFYMMWRPFGELGMHKNYLGDQSYLVRSKYGCGMKSLEGEVVVLLCCFTHKYSHSEDIMNSRKGKQLNSLPRTIYDASIYDASSQM